MKKILAATFIYILFLSAAHAQVMTKKGAHRYLDKAFSSLKRADTASFISLWGPDTTRQNAALPVTKAEIIASYKHLRTFMDTALSQNLRIALVEFQKDSLKNTEAEYLIKAWFRYAPQYAKGYGFYVARKNGKWVAISDPITLTSRNKLKSNFFKNIIL